MPLDTTNSLIDLFILKAFLGIAEADAQFDERLEQAIDGASWTLNTETSRLLKSRTLTEYYDGDGGTKLYLDQRPINSITSIHSDPTRAWAADSLIASTAYQVYGDEGYVVFTDTSVDVGHRVIRVIYVAGYSTVPYDLREACIELAALTYENFKEHRTMLKTVSSDAGTQSFEHGFSPRVKAAIKRYKRTWVL